MASLHHTIEHLLGLPQDFLDQPGSFTVQYNPAWPGQAFTGVAVWNVLLALLAAVLVVYVYTHDGRSKPIRIILGALRLSLLGLILFLLNRPMLTLNRSRVEPSVLAVLIDDSGSMKVPDVGTANTPRLSAVQNLLTGNNGRLLATLAKKHNLRLYKFDRDAVPLAGVASTAVNDDSGKPPAAPDVAAAVKDIGTLQAVGDSTQVIPSALNAGQDLQGQRVAGVVVLTDGRDTPARNIAAGLEAIKNYGWKMFLVPVGSDVLPKNIEVQSMQLDDVAFKGDVINVKAVVRASGFEPNHAVHVALRDKKTGVVLTGADGSPAEKTVNLPDDKPAEVELQWKTEEVGNREIAFDASKEKGELDEADNARSISVTVLDAKITVLFVDGYPRWEYRYLKTELLRDKSVQVSCLLASADPKFLQEGNKPLPASSKTAAGHFPDTLENLLEYDVVILGDVDPRYFSDNQLQLINEFVTRGGGLAMVAGPQFAPQSYRNSPIEPLLPVSIGRVEMTDTQSAITEGFRPVVTKTGDTTSIFRFFADKAKNDEFLKNGLQPIFWYCRGISAKPSVGEVLAEHPTDLGPDGHKAPILVAGRFGGRTLFSAIDDSWRWRFYTGESAFDSYWVQQIRYLARNRKIGQRRMTMTVDQPSYELGGQVRISLRVVDPTLVRQLPDQIKVEVRDAAGQPVRTETLIRQEGGGGETFVASFTADRVGKFTAHLQPQVSGVDAMDAPLDVSLPRLELVDPRVDRVQLSRLASETLGKTIDFNNAEKELADIPSAAKILPDPVGQPLWDAPLVMAAFMLLITVEWVTRKMYGMV